MDALSLLVLTSQQHPEDAALHKRVRQKTMELFYHLPYKHKKRTVNIPFFVNTETGEIEQSFRQSWSPFPLRLVTHSGTVVH